MSRRLLAEQNAEYEASLAADQEREARRQEEARRAQEVAQQQAAEEARQRCVGAGLEHRFACNDLSPVGASLAQLAFAICCYGLFIVWH
jgi:hypothetical protein